MHPSVVTNLRKILLRLLQSEHQQSPYILSFTPYFLEDLVCWCELCTSKYDFHMRVFTSVKFTKKKKKKKICLLKIYCVHIDKTFNISDFNWKQMKKKKNKTNLLRPNSDRFSCSHINRRHRYYNYVNLLYSNGYLFFWAFVFCCSKNNSRIAEFILV